MNLSFLMFLNSASIGVLTGLASDLSYLIKKIFRNNYIVNIAIDFCIYLVGASFVFVVASKLNNNIFAFYEPLGFVVGVILEKISCSNLFAKFFDIVISKLIKVYNSLQLTRFGKHLTK